MTKTPARIAIVMMFIGSAGAGMASAQTPATPLVKSASGQLGASINTAGLQQSFDFAASRPLTASANPWLSGAHAALGASLAASPAGVRGGAWVEYAPLSVLVFRAGAEPAQYFGTFQSLTSFESRVDAFDSDARKARGGAAAGRTTKLYLSGTAQLKRGNVLARSTVTEEHWSSTAAGPFFYEPTRDTLLATGGDQLASVTSFLLYQHQLEGGGQLMVGPMHSLARVGGSSLNQIQKLGVVAVHQSSGNHVGLIRPTLSAQVAYYLDDPSKKRQWSAAAAIGFSLAK